MRDLSDRRIEPHVVPHAPPRVAHAGQQILDLVRLRRRARAPSIGTCTIVSWAWSGSRLTAIKQLVPGRAACGRRGSRSFSAGGTTRFRNGCSAGFSRRMRFRRAISAVHVAGRVPVADADLVLLRVQVLLAARLDRHVLAELEAAVDAVERRQRRGEHEPHAERGPAARLQVLVQDVRRVREEVRPEVLRHLGLRELGQVLAAAPPRVPPGEVRVGLREAELRERLHPLRPRERLGEEDRRRDARA